MGQLKILEKNQHLLKIFLKNFARMVKGRVLGYSKLGACFQNFQGIQSLWLRKVTARPKVENLFIKWKTCSSIFTVILLEFLAIHVYLPPKTCKHPPS
jgi:uncharacterized protein involved in tolerance to divalent cations